jgi:ATP-binding cassette subfamily B protein
VEANIRAARDDADLPEVRRCAAIACVDDAIDSFAKGYDTLVGERGVTLSGGQKQRVAIARMMMQHAPVMIFDDSLSAVDAETDEKIRKALLRELGESTVILISHRITTLMQADHILVLGQGGAADIGTHAELITRPGLYRDIYEIQMRADDRALLEGGEA